MQFRLTFIFLLAVISSSNKLFPQEPDSIVFKANQLYEAKKYPEAIQFFNQANQYSPLSDDNLTILAKAYSKNEEYQKATEIFSELLQKEKPDIQIYYWHAVNLCYIDTADNFPSAKPFFETFIKSAEKDTLNQLKYLREAYRYMMSYHIYDTKGNKDSTIFYANKLVDISNNNITGQCAGYGGLMWTYFEKKDFKNAEIYCIMFLQIEPEDKAAKELYKYFKYVKRSNSMNYWQERINSEISFPIVKKAIEQNLTVYLEKEFINESLLDTIKLWIPNFNMASRGEKWEIADVNSDRNKPTRQLHFILKNEENIFIVYHHGGIGVSTQYIWAKLNKGLIEDIWCGNCFPKEADSVEKFKKHILTGKPKVAYLSFL